MNEKSGDGNQMACFSTYPVIVILTLLKQDMLVTFSI